MTHRGGVSRSILLGATDAGDGAGTWTVEVRPQSHPTGVQVTVAGAVTVAPGGDALVPVTARAAGDAGAGEAYGFLLRRGDVVRKVPYAMLVTRPGLASPVTPLQQFQTGTTLRGVSRASAYRYLRRLRAAPNYFGAPVDEDGAEKLYRIRLDEPAINVGAAVVASSDGSLIHPWLLGSADENDVQGYPGTPVNVNNLTIDYPIDVGAAARFPRTYYVAVDSGRDEFTGRSLGGEYVLRAWVDDLRPPLIGLITTRVAAGRPTLALRVLDLESGVDPYSLVIGYGRALIGAAAYDPASGVALFPLPSDAPQLRAGRRVLSASGADFQEAKNVDSVGDERLPNTAFAEGPIRVERTGGDVGRPGEERVRGGPDAARRPRVLDRGGSLGPVLPRPHAPRDRAARPCRAVHGDPAPRGGRQGEAHAARDRHRRGERQRPSGSCGSAARREGGRRHRRLERHRRGDGPGLARRGWRCVLVARRRERLEPLAAELGGEFELCDVSDREAVERAGAAILERYPRIDLLVNNAGIPGRAGPHARRRPDRGGAADRLPRRRLVLARSSRGCSRARTSSTSSPSRARSPSRPPGRTRRRSTRSSPSRARSPHCSHRAASRCTPCCPASSRRRASRSQSALGAGSFAAPWWGPSSSRPGSSTPSSRGSASSSSRAGTGSARSRRRSSPASWPGSCAARATAGLFQLRSRGSALADPGRARSLKASASRPQDQKGSTQSLAVDDRPACAPRSLLMPVAIS